jgi:hypothetical protein
MLIQFATASDVWAWCAAARSANARTPTGKAYRCLLAQAGVSEAYALRSQPGEVPRVIAGIVDLGPDEGELWFLGPPSGRGGLGPWLVHVVRFGRSWFVQSQARHPRRLVCHVRPGHYDGQRLCRLLGFAPAGFVNGFEVWRREP